MVDDDFWALGEKTSRYVDSEKIQIIQYGSILEANGDLLRYVWINHIVIEPDHISNTPKRNSYSFATADYILERVRGSYIADV